MTTNPRKIACYTREKAKIYQQILDAMENDKSYQDDPIWQRAAEIGRERHIQPTEAFKLAEQEFQNK